MFDCAVDCVGSNMVCNSSSVIDLECYANPTTSGTCVNVTRNITQCVVGTPNGGNCDITGQSCKPCGSPARKLGNKAWSFLCYVYRDVEA